MTSAQENMLGFIAGEMQTHLTSLGQKESSKALMCSPFRPPVPLNQVRTPHWLENKPWVFISGRELTHSFSGIPFAFGSKRKWFFHMVFMIAFQIEFFTFAYVGPEVKRENSRDQ